MSHIDNALVAEAAELRHEIHAKPELSNRETATSQRVRAMLERHGVSAIRPVGGTAGLVVEIASPARGPTVLLKADLDALPIQQECEPAFRSTVPGVMHACGHDVHTAILAAVAVALSRRSGTLAGRVLCVFQPAEEAEPLGARQVVGLGLLDGVDVALAAHVDPDLPLGMIGGLSAGPRSAASDEIDVIVHGRASHGAKPHQGVDALAAAAAVVQSLQQVVSRMNEPRTPMVLSFGRLAAGQARNAIADSARLEGILRTTTAAQRAEAHAHVRRVVEAVAAAHGATAEVKITTGEPVIANDPGLVALAREVATGLVGAGAVSDGPPPSMGADDFGFYLEHARGLMLRLGVRDESTGMKYPLHHPRFFAPDSVIPVGAGVLAALAERVLRA